MTGTEEPAKPVIRVGLVDDQLLVRAGFAMVINSQPDLRVEGEAGTGDEAIRLFARQKVDVILMDIRMPGLDGLSATAALVATPGAPKVIVLTTFDLDEYVLGAIRAGASGFLVKDTPPEDMLAAIRTVHAGDAVIGPSSTRRLLDQLAAILPGQSAAVGAAAGIGHGGAPDPAGAESAAAADAAARATALVDGLTDREREVLVLMARGRSNTEISRDLVVAEATVKTHVGRVLAKLGARDRVQAVVVAYEAGLVTPGA
jgi:DNA-binding NarL/FixJ family response regulator